MPAVISAVEMEAIHFNGGLDLVLGHRMMFFLELLSLKMRELPPQVGNFGGENQDKPWGFQTNANGIVFRCF